MLSHRGNTMPASPIRRLIPYANEAKRKGIEVYHLNIGQPDIPTPPEIFEAIRNFPDKVLPYGPSEGLPETREVIADYFRRYGIEVSPDEVFITTGGSEAIIFSLMAITDPGDEVLIPEPFYTNYGGFAHMSSVRLVPIPTSVEDGFRLPPDEVIEERITERTRGIIIITPNNPTGTVYTREEMERIGRIAKKHNLFVFSDEVYREFVFDGKRHTSILEIEGIEDRCAVLDSISKRFSACGARIGFVVSRNKKFLDALLRFGQARLCPPTIEQMGAIAGFKYMNNFMQDMVDEYRRRRDVVYEEIMKIEGAFTLKPEGAFYTVVRLPVKNAEDFIIWMLTSFSVDGKTTMVAPANGFYATPGKGEDEVRIAYVLEVEKLRHAMEILRLGIERYRNEVEG